MRGILPAVYLILIVVFMAQTALAQTDTKGPLIVFNSPDNGSEIPGTIEDLNFNASVTDTSGVQSVSFGYVVSGSSNNVMWVAGSKYSTSDYWTATVDRTDLDEGNYNLSVRSYDNEDNPTESLDVATVIFDKSAPTLTNNITTSIPGLGFVVYVTSTDSLTGVDRVQFGFSAPGKTTVWSPGSIFAGHQWHLSSNSLLGQIEDGSYNVNIRSYDRAGNVNTLSDVGEVEVDTINPEVSLVEPVAGNYSGDLLFRASASDNGSGVSSVSFGYKRQGDTRTARLTGTESGGYWISSLDTTTLLDGSYSISVRALDTGGNDKELEDVVEIVVDNTNPDVSLVVPVDGNYSNGVLFNASSSDAGSGVMLVEFGYENSNVPLKWFEGGLLDGTIISNGHWNATFDTTGISDGYYNVSVRSTDFADNTVEALKVAEIRVDNVEPVVSFISPVAGNHSDTLLFSASSSDGSTGVKIVQFGYRLSGEGIMWLDGVESNGHWSYSLDTTANNFEDGSYSLSVRSIDFAGNENALLDNVDVIIDNLAPEVELIDPVAGSYREFLSFKASSTDEGVGVRKVEFGYAPPGSNPSEWLVGIKDAEGNWTAALDTRTLNDGDYGISVRSTDFAGKQTELLNWILITIDNTNPEVSIVSPMNYCNKSAVLSINASSNDSTSGVKEVFFGYRKEGSTHIEWIPASSEDRFWTADVDTIVSGLNDGSYHLSVRSTDNAGNQNESLNLVKIVVDNTKPSFSGFNPRSGGYYANSLTFSVYATDELSGVSLVEFGYRVLGEANVREWLNGTSINNNDDWVASFTTTDLPDGRYQLSVRVTDFANNTELGDDVSVVTVDNTKPQVHLQSPLDGSSNSGDLLFNASSNDGGVSGVDFVEFGYVKNGSSDQPVWVRSLDAGEDGYWTYSLDIRTFDDGYYNVSVSSTDKAANSNRVDNNATVIIDNTPPVIDFTSPAAGNYSRTIEFVAQAEDPLSDVKNLSFGYQHSDDLEVTWIVAEEFADSWTASLNTLDPGLNLDEGTYSLSVRSSDFAGNEKVSLGVVAITVDNTPTGVSFVAPAEGNYGGSLTFRARPEVPEEVKLVEFGYRAGSSAVEWFDGTKDSDGNWSGVLDTTGIADGSYNLSVRVTDSANNPKELLDAIEVIFDNANPTVSLRAPVEGNHSGSILFNASSNDANGVSSVVFGYAKSDGDGTVTWINGSEGTAGYWNATFDTSVPEDGLYNLSVLSTDSAGNENLLSNAVTVLIDNTLPEVELLSPVTGDFAGSILFNASSSDDLAGVTSVEFGYASPGNEIRWNDGLKDADGYRTFTLDIAPPFEEGSYTISVRSTDSAGNVNLVANAVQVKVDNSAPEFSLISPEAGDFRGILAFNASSDSGVSDVKSVEFGYALAGEEIEWLTGSEDAIGYWTFPLDTSSFTDGSYSLSVRSTDFAGNENLSEAVVEIIIDNSAPEVSLIAPVDGDNRNGEVMFEASSDGGSSSVELVEFGYRFIGGSSAVTWFDGALLQEFLWQAPLDTSGFTDGSYSLSVRSTDFAGNENELLDVAEIVIDNTLPDVSLVAPVEGDFSGNLVFNASSSDDLSGVELVEFGYRRSDEIEVTWISGSEGSTGYWNVTFDTSPLADGSYNVSVRSTDFAGNPNEIPDVVEIVIDNSLPDLELDLPEDGNYSGSIHFNATSDGGVSQVESVEFGYSRVGENLVNWFDGVERVRGVWSDDLDTTGILDGAYTLSVRATDFAGNVRLIPDVRSIFVDNALPDVSLVAPVAGDYNRDLLFNASSSDDGTGVSFVEFGYAASGENVTWFNATDIEDDHWSISVYTLAPRIPDGTYNVSVRSTDFAGNRKELPDVVEIVIDNSQPGISLVLPVAGNYSGNLPFRALSDGGASGVKLVEFGYSRVGEQLVNWFNGTQGADSWGGVLDTTALAEGTYTISVRGTDFADNQNLSADVVEVVLDNTDPGVSFVAPIPGDYSGEVRFRASSDDSLSDVKLVEFGYRNSPDVEVTWFDGTKTLDGYHWEALFNTSVLDDGSYNVSVRSTDFADNENLSADVVEIVLDNTNPDVSLIIPVDGNYSSDLLFSASSDDALSGVELVEFGHRTFSYENVEWSNVTWFDGTDSNVTLPGATWPSISWFDVASGITTFNGVDFNVTWSDRTLSNSSDDNATWSNVTWSNVTWSNASSSVTWPSVTWANATLLTQIWSAITWFDAEKADDSWNTSFDTTELDDGFYTLNVRSTDSAGNVNEMLNLVEILVDNTLPDLSLVAPDEGNYSDDLVFNASSSDSLSGVKSVEFGYAAPGEAVIWIPSAEADGYWSNTFTTAGIDDGPYEISVRATDFAGNVNEMLNLVDVVIDNSAPFFSIREPEEGSYSGEIAFIASANDDVTDVELVEFGYGKPGSSIAWFGGYTFGGGVWHGSLDTIALIDEDGTYSLAIRVTDLAGNENVSESFAEVVIDNALPNVSLDVPVDGNYSGELLFSATSNDSVSGVKSVRFGYRQRGETNATWSEGTETATGQWTAAFDTTEISDGYYTLSVNSTDFSGNENLLEDIVDVVIDNTNPGVSLASPVEGAYGGNLLFRASSDDSLSGVKLVEFGHRTFSYQNVEWSNVTWFDGTDSNVTLPDAAWPSISWFDVASGVTTFSGNDFTVTWSDRTLSNSSDDNATWSNVTWSNVMWSNSSSNVTWPSVTWANATLLTQIWSEITWFSGEEVDNSWLATLNTLELTDGYYTLSVRSTDFADNENLSENVVQIIIDNTLPSVSLIAPVQGAFMGEVLFNASSDSGVSGIKLIEFGYRSQDASATDVTWFDGTESDGYWTAPLDTSVLDDGSYILSVRTTDSADNVRLVPDVRVIVVDNTQPDVSLIAPVAGDYSGMLLFNASSDDLLSGVESVEFTYAQSGGNPGTLGGSKDANGYWNATLDTSVLDDGSYDVNVISTDSAGNQRELPVTVEILIDNSPPTVKLLSPLTGNFSGVVDDFLGDSDSGVSKVSLLEFGYALDGEPVTWFDGTPLSGRQVWRGALDTTTVPDGTYDLSVRSTDFAGNQNESLNVADIVIDNRAPTISLLASPLVGSYNGDLLFNASFGDIATGIKNVEFGYRNSSDANVIITWLSGSEGTEGYWNATLDTTSIADGYYNVSVRSTDFLDNQNTSDNLVRITIDNSEPGLSLVAPDAGNYSGTLLFNASATDALSDVKSVQFGYNLAGENVTWLDGVEELDGSFWTTPLDTTFLEDGRYNVSVRSNDSLDNKNEILDAVEIIVDNLPPSFELLSPVSGTFNGNVLFNASATDSGTGVKSVDFGYNPAGDSNVTWVEASEDADGYWVAAVDTSEFEDGTYFIHIRSADFYGNDDKFSDVAEILLDNQPPVAVLISPEANNYTGSIVLNASVEDSGTGVESVQFSYVVFGSDSVTDYDGVEGPDGYWSYNLDTSTLVDGTYLLYVKSNDSSGHYNAFVPVTIVVDNSAPEVLMVAPDAGSYSGDLLLRAESDGGVIDVSLVEFGYRNSDDANAIISWFNGLAEDSGGFWNYTLDTSLLRDGSYMISVRSTDLLGQETVLEDVVEVALDNTRPVVSLVAPVAGDYMGELVFNASSDGGASGVELVEFGYRGSDADAVITWFDGSEDANGYWSATLNTTLLPDDVYTLSARSTDFAGNRMESLDVVRIVVDHSAPDLSLIVPVAGNYSGELVFNASSDGGAGRVQLVEFGYGKSSGGSVTWIDGTDDGRDYWSKVFDTTELEEDSYNVSVRSTDSVGNQNELLNQVMIIIDNSAPQVSLIKFTEGNLRGNKEFSVLSTDGGVGVNFVEFGYSMHPGTGETVWFNGSEFSASIDTDLWVYELDTADLADGTYNVSVRSTDFSGNFNLSANAGQIVIDNAKPEVSLVAPVEGAVFNGNLNFLAASTDATSGVQLVEFGYTIPRGQVQWIEGSESVDGYWNATLDASALTSSGDGVYLLSVRSTDFAGNENEFPNVVEVTRDSTMQDDSAPSVSLISPSAGNVSGTLDLIAVVYDGLSTVDTVSFGHATGGGSVTWTTGTEGASGYWSAELDTTALVDGTVYSLSVNATDSAGYTNESLNIIEILVDNSLPAITLVAPLEGDEITGELLFNASVDDVNTGVAFVEFGYAPAGGRFTWLNGTENADDYWTFTLDTMDFAEGTYDVSVRATDFAGNGVELADPVEVIIDNSAPELSLIVPVAGNYSGELQLEASATDGGTGVDFVQFGYANPGEETTWLSGSRISLPDRWYYTLQTATLNDGLYDLSLRSNDSNDNEKLLSNIVRITVDNTLPEVELLAPLGGNVSGNLKFFARSDDDTSGVQLVEFGYARSGGNPVWVHGTETVSGTWSYLLDTAGASFSNGSYAVSVRSTDFAGNQNETLDAAEISWTDVPVDQVTSAVSLIAPVADSYSGELFFYASSIGGVSSVKSVSFGYGRGARVIEWIPAVEVEPAVWGAGFDTTSLSDGYYNVSVRSTDFYDVETISSDVVEILLDNTEPDISVVSPAAGIYDGTLLFNASVTDALSGVSSVSFGYSSGGEVEWLDATEGADGYWNVSLELDALEDGHYHLSVRAVDNAGTENLMSNFVQVTIDNLNPSLAVISPEEGNYSGNLLFNASANDTGAGISSVEFGYARPGDEITWFSANDDGNGYWTFPLDTSALDDGSHELSVNATDLYGRENVSMNFAEIVVDNTDPVLVRIKPDPAAGPFTGVVDFHAHSEDSGTGVKLVEFGYAPVGGSVVWIDGTETSTNNWETSVPTTDLVDDSYDVSVRSTDFAGNVKELPASVRIVVDNFGSDKDAPTVSLEAPVAITGNHTGELSFRAIATDSDSGVKSVGFGYARKGQNVMWIDGTNSNGDEWTATFDTTEVQDGNYSISVNATDRAGNPTVMENVVWIYFGNFGFDNVAPDVSLVSPVAGNYSGDLLFNASASDSGTGVKVVQFGYTPADGSITWFDSTEGVPGYWNATFNTTAIEDGTYNVSVQATDSANNPATLENVTEIVVDNTAPEVSFVDPVEGNYSADSIAFTSQSSDAVTGVKLVEFGYGLYDSEDFMWFDGTETADGWDGSLATADLEDGSYNVSVRCTDFAGNSNVSSRMIVIDRTAPDATLIAPVTGSFNSSLTFIASSSDDTSGVKLVEFGYALGGGNPAWHDGTMVAPGYWTASPSDVLTNDVYKLSVRSTDFAGNDNEFLDVAEITLSATPVADNDAPGVEFVAPAAGSYRGELELIALSYDSLSEVETLMFGYSRDGGDVTWLNGSVLVPGFWNASLHTDELADGYYDISLNATDSEGNENVSSDLVRITVDNTGPVFSLVSPSAGNVEDVEVINASVSDASGVESVQFGYRRSSGTVTWLNATEGTAGYWNASLNTSLLVEDASYTLLVKAIDSLGNERLDDNALQITVNNVADPSTGGGGGSSRRSSGGGGGGGGGSRSTTTTPTPQVTSQSQSWDVILADSDTRFRITRSGIPVSEVVFTVTENVSDVELTMTAEPGKPPYIATGYPGIVYQYLTLSRSGLDDSSVSSVTIGFSVNRSFISEHNASMDDIIMARYYDGQWNELETNSKGSDINYYYYEAVSPGLSTFVIALREPEEPEEPVVVPIGETNETVTPEPEEPVNGSETEEPEEPAGPSLSDGVVDPTRGALVVIIVVVAGLTAYVLYRRSKRKSEFVKGFVYPKTKSDEKEHPRHPEGHRVTHHPKHHHKEK